jgi:hypothetical protein
MCVFWWVWWKINIINVNSIGEGKAVVGCGGFVREPGKRMVGVMEEELGGCISFAVVYC